MNRRQFLMAVAGGSLVIPVLGGRQQYVGTYTSNEWIRRDAAEPVASSVMDDMKAMCGVQRIETVSGMGRYDSHTSLPFDTLAFVLRSMYLNVPDFHVRRVQPSDFLVAKPFVLPDPLPELSMRFEIMSERVRVTRRTSLLEWRLRAARHLCLHAKRDLLSEDPHGGYRAIIGKLGPNLAMGAEITTLTKEYHQKVRFNFIRKQNAIARATRRGMGNTVIGSTDAVRDLMADLSESTRSGLRIVQFEPGEAYPEPWALVGYNGSHCFDSGLIFVHQGEPEDMSGGFHDHMIERYWRRLV